MVDGSWTLDERSIELEFEMFFRALYKNMEYVPNCESTHQSTHQGGRLQGGEVEAQGSNDEGQHQENSSWLHNLLSLSVEQIAHLSAPFSESEIRCAVF